MQSWIFGTPDDDWVSMAVYSDGSYGVAEGLIYSFPVKITDGNYAIVPGLAINAFSQDRLNETEQELVAEREMVNHLF